MTSFGNSLPPTSESVSLAAPLATNSLLSTAGADLVLTQDESGQCLSFYWRDADRYGLRPEQVVKPPLMAIFMPIEPGIYRERLRHVLDCLTPLRFEYAFVYDDRYLVFDLTVSPLLMPLGNATTLVVVGQFCYEATPAAALELAQSLLHCTVSAQANRQQARLDQVIRNIRRSLDLETICQQTVDGLGEALGVSRCVICPYHPDRPLSVAAEFRSGQLSSWQNASLSLENHPLLQQALETRKPLAVSSLTHSTLQQHPESSSEVVHSSEATLIIATCYQDQPNGLILLYQTDRARVWKALEIDLLQEIADQVGTGMAHALLFQESRKIAAELQRVNDSLIQQHRETEEARQQAEAASRLKSEFLANTSHELRTPLNGMIGFLKLIIDGMADDPAEQTEFLQEAYRSAVHLLNIINDILDIAKIEAGKMQLDTGPIVLDELLNEVEKFTRTQTQQKRLRFEIRTPATCDKVVLDGNYQRLLQVMLNLVGNAIKFTHEGGIVISAEILPDKGLGQTQDKPGLVKISVADTGIGVSLEKQDKLFQSFSQVDGSRTRQYGGTGLGLAISQKLVEAMGGVVNFYSMGEGLGSTVTFTVPLYHDPVMVDDLAL